MGQHTFRLDDADEQILEALARRLGYSQSDALRYAIRVATVSLSLRLPRPINDRLGLRGRYGEHQPPHPAR